MKDLLVSLIALVILGVLFVGFIYVTGSVRLDYGEGSHMIQPTAIDKTMYGHYKVYYRTSAYTQNSQEDYYFIDKDRSDLAEQMQKYIKNKDTVMVYYEKFVGWKGFTAPDSSPIIKIEIVEE